MLQPAKVHQARVTLLIKATFMTNIASGPRETSQPTLNRSQESNHHRYPIYPNIINETKLGPTLRHAPHPTGELMTRRNYNTPLIKGRSYKAGF